jgi:DNA-binding transcriptional ArsR family regulator
MDAVIRAIAEPRRRDILRLVWDAELAAGEIAEHFDVTRPAISQHLTVLKSAGLIEERREGTRRLYRARPEVLADLRTYLDGFWAGRLQLLKDAVERDATARRDAEPVRQHGETPDTKPTELTNWTQQKENDRGTD